ncbi:hypothetical protein [Kitasatospora sp. HPMI-4]|uniref:hypothetical protein n=1 Tax=Kitasatospora sp. HPMI-4 TaxID=3448443 RepID=UPI003F1B48B8
MRGLDVIAEVLSTGRFLGLGPGSTADEVTSRFGDGVSEVHGTQPGTRLLRIDYGLVEFTFGGEPDWACRWYSVQLHRLASSPGLAGRVEQRFGLRFDEAVHWADLPAELRRTARAEGPVEPDDWPRFARYRIEPSKATVHTAAFDELSETIEKIVIGV